jgi:hypothetical protein
MADTDEGGYKLRFLRAEFTSLVGNISIALLRTELIALVLSVPITDARMMLLGNGVTVEWLGEPPTVADRQAVRDKVASFVGGTTTSAPIEVESLGITSATTAALVDVIDVTTPPRDGGTYLIVTASLLGMLATVANTGVRGVVTMTRIRGATSKSRQWEHNWTRAEPQFFGPCLDFRCEAGDVLRVLMQVGKVGAAAATAQMSMARVSIDQIAPAGA